MKIEEFITNFAAQFDETEPAIFTKDTKFKDIEEWNSLLALTIIAMADDEYGVKLTGEDVKSSTTIEDIFNKVKNKKNV